MSEDSRESLPNRIVSFSKSYVIPIVKGKGIKIVKYRVKCLSIQIDGILFIEKQPFNVFSEDTILKHSVSLSK